MATKRDSRGRFKSGGGGSRKRKRKSTAIVVSGPRSVARRSVAIVAPATRVVSRGRRGGGGLVSGGGGGALGGVGKYLGGVRGDDLTAAVVLGGLTRSDTGKGYIKSVVNAVGPLGRIGALGVIAVGAGVLAHQNVGRRFMAPLARAASTIAAYKLTARGELYADGDAGMAQLAGDDDETSGDGAVMDVGALADDNVAGDDDETSGDDDD